MAVMELWRRTTVLDRLLVLVLLAGALLGSIGLGRFAGGTWLVVTQNGAIVFRAALAEDRRIVLPGPLGETVIEIMAGNACVVAAACPEKVCIGMGRIRRSGEIIACVPNRLVLAVVGGPNAGGDYDLVSR